MSLAGYRNLTTLKARLLPADLGADSTWDGDLAGIGAGVAAEFDAFTGRTLRRTVGAVYQTAADVYSVVLACYPVESIASVILTSGSGTQDVTPSIQGTFGKSGIVEFMGAPGSHLDKLEITSTGGFWCDAGDAVAMPNGATPLPEDLLQAWYQQCRAVCEAENTFRQKGAAKPDPKNSGGLDKLALLPGVKRTLQLYIRLG